MRTHRLLLPLDFLIVLFVLTGLVLGGQFSYDPTLGYVVQVGLILGLLVYLALAHGLATWEIAYPISRILVLAGTGYAVFFILQYGYQGYTENPALIERIGQLTTLLPDLGIFPGHLNAAATFLESMIPLGVVLVLTSLTRPIKIFWAVCTLVCLYALVLTFSRGAFVALGVGLCLSMIVLGRNQLTRLGGAALLIGGAAALLLTNAGSEWVLGRWELYRNSFYVASDYTFTGIGLGETFPLVYSRYGLLIQVPFLTYAHNLALSVWMGHGLPGLLVFGLLLLTFYRFVWRVIRSGRVRRLFHAAWLSVTITLIHGLFDSRHYVEAVWLMTHLLALFGLTAGAGRLALARALERDRTILTRYFPWRLAIGSLIGFVIAGVAFQPTVRAVWHTNLGAVAQTRAELTEFLPDSERSVLQAEAIRHYEQALSYVPNWPNASRRLGNLYLNLERFAEAVPLLETAYILEPDNPAAIKGLGLAYMWAGRPEDAAQVLAQSGDQRQVSDEVVTWGYWRQSEKNQPLLAAYAYETVQALSPTGGSVVVGLLAADAYRNAGQNDRARLWYEWVLEQEPGNTAAQDGLRALSGS
jgi:hypothetical protein